MIDTNKGKHQVVATREKRPAQVHLTSPLAATQVWTALYTIMGLSAREVWKHTGLQGLPLALYAAQLALNFAWSPLFFLKHEIGLALVDISGALAAGSTEFCSASVCLGPAVSA